MIQALPLYSLAWSNRIIPRVCMHHVELANDRSIACINLPLRLTLLSAIFFARFFVSAKPSLRPRQTVVGV